MMQIVKKIVLKRNSKYVKALNHQIDLKQLINRLLYCIFISSIDWIRLYWHGLFCTRRKIYFN